MTRKQNMLKGKQLNYEHTLITNGKGEFIAIRIYLPQGQTQISINKSNDSLLITTSDNEDRKRLVAIEQMTEGVLQIK